MLCSRVRALSHFIGGFTLALSSEKHEQVVRDDSELFTSDSACFSGRSCDASRRPLHLTLRRRCRLATTPLFLLRKRQTSFLPLRRRATGAGERHLRFGTS